MTETTENSLFKKAIVLPLFMRWQCLLFYAVEGFIVRRAVDMGLAAATGNTRSIDADWTSPESIWYYEPMNIVADLAFAALSCATLGASAFANAAYGALAVSLEAVATATAETAAVAMIRQAGLHGTLTAFAKANRGGGGGGGGTRATNLDPGVGKRLVGPALDRDAAIAAGKAGEDLTAGSRREARELATAIGDGKPPILEKDAFGPHYHPFGRKPNIHIWW